MRKKEPSELSLRYLKMWELRTLVLVSGVDLVVIDDYDVQLEFFRAMSQNRLLTPGRKWHGRRFEYQT